VSPTISNRSDGSRGREGSSLQRDPRGDGARPRTSMSTRRDCAHVDSSRSRKDFASQALDGHRPRATMSTRRNSAPTVRTLTPPRRSTADSAGVRTWHALPGVIPTPRITETGIAARRTCGAELVRSCPAALQGCRVQWPSGARRGQGQWPCRTAAAVGSAPTPSRAGNRRQRGCRADFGLRDP
jgi:hypothetical protein